MRSHLIISDFALCALAIYFLGLGLRGILTKKAFLVSTQRMFWVLPIAFLPLFWPVDGMISGFRNHSFDFMELFPLMIIFTVFFLVFWKNRGYSVWGATEEYLQAALHSSLQSLNLAYEESVTRLRLTSLDADLTVSVSGFGVAYIRLKQPRHGSTLKQIARQMNVYFATIPGKTTMTPFYIYASLGILLLTQTIWILRNAH